MCGCYECECRGRADEDLVLLPGDRVQVGPYERRVLHVIPGGWPILDTPSGEGEIVDPSRIERRIS